MEEVGFADQFVEPNAKPTKQLEVVAKDIPILVDVEMEVGFHDQSVGSDMEIANHLVMDDPVVVGDELCVVEHLVVSNEMVDVEILAYVVVDFFVADVEFAYASVHSLAVDVDEGLLLKHYVQFFLGCDHAN